MDAWRLPIQKDCDTLKEPGKFGCQAALAVILQISVTWKVSPQLMQNQFKLRLEESLDHVSLES